MFWYSQFFWYSAALILILAIIGLGIAIYVRIRLLENKFRLEITNRGNMTSRYLLRLDNPDRSLAFRFNHVSGGRLPVEEIMGLPGPSQAERENAPSASSQAAAPVPHQGIEAMGTKVQSAGYTVTEYAPTEVSSPVVEANSTLYQGQTALGTLQYYLRKLGLGDQSGSQTPAVTREKVMPSGERWAITDAVEPGKTMPVRLTVRKKLARGPRQSLQDALRGSEVLKWSFRLVSRAREDDQSPAVVSEGIAKIVRSFWTRPVHPELLIIGVAVLLVLGMAVLTTIFQI